MKNKKSKKKRRLLLAILMLLLTGAMTVTTSYAWFTANKTVTVSTINVNVAASNGLQISVDAKEWKSIITNDDITRVITDESYESNTNQLPGELASLSPVSSAGELDEEGKMKMFLGTIDSDARGNYQLTAKQDKETKTTESGNFVVFDLFFQVQDRTQIYLTDQSKVKAGAKDTGIHNAARVAFILEGTKEAGTDTTSIQELKNSGATPVIWEPNYDVHTLSGVANARDVYSITTTVTGGSKLAYNGVKADIESGVPLTDTTADYFKSVIPQIYTTEAGILDSAYESVLELPAGISKVKIYMWVEGQDVDCENIASGGSISYDLQFSVNSSSAG